MGATIAFAAVVVLTALFTSAPIFRAEAYRALIGTVEEGAFHDDIEVIDQSQIRIVDEGLAARRAEELIGTDPGLGSRVHFGTFTVQNVAGKLYWVAPLEHSDFLRWFNNESTPGYVMVSASDLRDARIVLQRDGKSMALRYMPSSYFGYDLERHLWQSGYATTGFTDFNFELDDSGRPYWVVTLYKKNVGFGGSKATGVAIVDPETGAISEYGIDDAPKWVDRIQPASFIVEQLDDWGEYVHGWWNFSGLDIMKTTPGIGLVYTADGRAAWYTGMQARGRDNGTTGFMLVDSRTGKARFYHVVGATEGGTQKAIEGKIANFRYHATAPILYNIGGVPTFLSTLKDDAGNFKGIGIAAVENRSIVVAEEDLRTALRAYANALSALGNAVAVEGSATLTKIEGRVSRLGVETMKDGTFYYLLLEEAPDRIYVGTARLSPKLPLTREGDRIAIRADDTMTPVVDMAGFDNLDLELRRNPRQEALEAAAESARETEKAARQERAAEDAWKKLSPAEKKKLLESLRKTGG